jgi:tetratricopeptide (TPR) repeat protein
MGAHVSLRIGFAAILGLGLGAGSGVLSTHAGVGGTIADKPSLLGSYLAGRLARGEHDTRAAAVYYRQALAGDPESEVLVEQSFLVELTQGNWPRAEALARELVGQQPPHRTARALTGLVDFKAGRYAAADENFQAASANPIGELTSLLARAWTAEAGGRTDAALALLEAPKLPEWAQYYLRYHRALLADEAGRRAEARAAYEKIPKNDQRTLRVTLAYARHLANAGDPKQALSLIKAHFEKANGEANPVAKALHEDIDAGRRIDPLVTTPTEGLSEAFYGLGEALAAEGGIAVGAVYLQFALYLTPTSPFALAALANTYEATKRYDDAIDAYDRIPRGSPLQSSIDIRKALNLNQLERVEEAQKLLEDLARQHSHDIRVFDALGGIMRGHKRYEEAVDYYSRAIALIDKPEAKQWTYYYSRGTSYERIKKWPLAEADLQKALQLSADQPLVLNYLGYSWIDQNRNLKQGLALIEKAVRQKPEDGYIVDSLGWAHFRMGNFKEATKNLERAVELRPEDPVLNDHLGDAYWRVGREREARFQWDQALTLKPEPEDAEKIKKKLQRGLQLPAQARRTKDAQLPAKRRLTKSQTNPFLQ